MKNRFFLFLIFTSNMLAAQKHPDTWIDVTCGNGAKEVYDITNYFEETEELDTKGEPIVKLNFTNFEIYKYDLLGNWILEARYYPISTLENHWTATYEGKDIQEKVIYNSDSIPTSRVVYTYSINNQLLRRETFLNKDAIADAIKLNKDDLNGMMSFIRLMNTSSAYDSLVYNSRGDLVKNFMFKNGQMIRVQSWDYVYDDGDRVLKKTFVSGKTIMRKWGYSYNEVGQEITRTRYRDRGIFEWSKTYIYDVKGRVAVERQFKDEEQTQLQMSWTYTYNSDETLKERSFFIDSKKPKATYKYRYDENKNWIVRQVIFDGKLTSERNRKIIY